MVILVNKFSVFSTFTGAGGFDIGFHGDFDFLGKYFPRLNFETVTAIDINVDACKSLNYNKKYFKDTHVIHQDITTVDISQFDDEIDVLTGGFPCFLKGTKIQTEKGYKNIEDIKVGEKVLTHENRYKDVLLTMKNKTDKVHYIKTMGVSRIKTTSNHPFYVKRRTTYSKIIGKTESGKKKQKIFFKFDTPKWVEAKDLKKNDFIGMNINKESILPKWMGISSKVNSKKIKIKNNLSKYMNNKDFWWFVGRYIADGWLISHKRKDRKNSYVWKTYLCAGYHEKESIERELNKLDLHYTIDNDRTAIKYIFSNEELYKFLFQFKKLAHNKSINNTILDLPITLLKEFLDGYLSGDGSYNIKTNVHSFSTVSKELFLGIQQAIHKVYKVPCKAYFNKNKKTSTIEGRIINQKNSFQGSFIINGKNHSALIEDDIIWFPFKSQKIIEENIETYNLSVDEDNSYTANNVIVHNCLQFSMVGKRLGITDDISGKLYETFVDFVDELKPKIFIAENVKGILSANKGEAIKIITKRFEDTGYKLKVVLVNFADYGVPQLRERVLFIGIREDIKDNFEIPEKVEKHITSGEAFKGINKKCENHTFIKQLAKTTERINAIPEGGNFKDLPPELSIKGVMSNIYRRLDRKKPAYTVLAAGGGGTWHYHFKEPRALTNRERARLQSFPDDYIFQGTNTEGRRQIGNAVPPVGIYSFAEECQRILAAEYIKNKYNK